MWNSSVPGHGAGGVSYGGGLVGQYSGRVSHKEVKKGDVDTDKNGVAALLGRLDDAEKTSKSQVVQDLRDKLNEKRKELGDEKFKALLEQIKKEQSESLLALLRKLFPDLFPDEAAPSPASQPSPGQGGGGGGQNSANLGPRESMSNQPFTQGAQYHHYNPDKSDPGRKPGQGKDKGNIWSGFSQSQGTQNCVTIAAIKAAQMQYGKKPTDVYRDVKQAGDGYDVLMRDGETYHVSQSEIKRAAEQARFQGDDPEALTNANFMYAVSAKRAQNERNDGIDEKDFGAALNSLNDGEVLQEGLDRLGLRGLYRQSSSSELGGGRLGVVAFSKHAMAVIGGQIELNGGRGGPPEQGQAFAFV